MNAWTRTVAGAAGLVLGAVLWVMIWARFGPAVVVGSREWIWQGVDGLSLGCRWAAVSLATGGLLLAVRNWRRGTWLALSLGGGWLASDAILSFALAGTAGRGPASTSALPIGDQLVVTSLLAPTIVAAVAGVAGLGLVGAAHRRDQAVTPAPMLLPAAGALLALRPNWASTWAGTFEQLGSLVQVLPLAMIVLAMLLALSVPTHLNWRRVAAAGVVVALMVVLAVPALATPLTRWLSDELGALKPGYLSLYGLLPPALLLATLVAVTGVLPRGRRAAVAFGALLVGTFVGVTFLVPNMVVQPWAVGYLDHLPDRAYAWGLMAGSLISACVAATLVTVAAWLVARGGPAPSDVAVEHAPATGAAGAHASTTGAAEGHASTTGAAGGHASITGAAGEQESVAGAAGEQAAGASAGSASAVTSQRSWAGRLVLGVVLAALGLAAWLASALLVQRRIDQIFWSWHGPGGVIPHGIDDTYALGGLGWDLRFATIVIAAGGLRLLATSRRRARWALAVAVAWVVADALLLLKGEAAARASLDSGMGSAGVAAAAWSAGAAVWVIAGLVVVGAGVLGLLARRARGATALPVGSLMYGAASLGLGLVLPLGLSAAVVAATPSWLPTAVTVLAMLLVGGGVLSCAVTGPRSGAGAVTAALATIVVGAVAVAGLTWRRLAPDTADAADAMWLLALGTFVLAGASVLVLAWLSGQWPTNPRWAVRVVAVLTPMGSVAVFVSAVWASLFLEEQLRVMLRAVTTATSPFFFDDGALPLTLIGVAAGAILGLVTLLPRALSTPDMFGPARAVPTPPKPPAPAARAPLAVPGVPEVLEHPRPAAPRL